MYGKVMNLFSSIAIYRLGYTARRSASTLVELDSVASRIISPDGLPSKGEN